MSADLTLSPWLVLLLSLPVLCLGEWLVRHVRWLARYSLPAPVVGGVLFAGFVLAAGLAGWSVRLELGTAVRAWNWLVTPEAAGSVAVKSVNLPLLAAFFAVVGLDASWPRLRPAGSPALVFLLLASIFAILQNFIAVALAALLGISPLLALVCGSMSLTGGHATTLGFAAEFERAGLEGAQTFGLAAATAGLVAGALLAGPIGRTLCRRHGLQSADPGTGATFAAGAPAGLLAHLRVLAASPGATLMHLGLLAFCLKSGAWISHLLQRNGLVFPVFVGTLCAGVAVRAGLDWLRPAWFVQRVNDSLGTVALAFFLAVAMMALNLQDLLQAAGPLAVILTGQVAAMAAFAWWVTFPLMGRNYDAAVVAAGHCGFALGSTATALAGMKAIEETCGAAPRAFLIVPLVGGFLVDLVNAANLTAFISFLHRT